MAVGLVVLTGVAPAAAISPLTGPPNFRLTAPAPVVVGTVDNGDFSRGLEGWRSAGRELPEVAAVDGGLAAVLRLNTTLTSPAFAVPPEAQSIVLVARAGGDGVLLQVAAIPEDGGTAVPLGSIAPGTGRAEFRLPAAGIRGRVVRLALDPVAAIGRSVEVGRVGPIETFVPGWTISAGAAEPVTSQGRRRLRVVDDPLELVSPAFTPGPAAQALVVAVRGEGRVTGNAGAAPGTLVAGSSWRDLRVPLAGAGPVNLTIRAVPGTGPVEIAELGLVVRQTSISALRVVRRGQVVIVRGRLVPAGGGLSVALRLPSGRRGAVARSTSTGAFALRARVSGRAVKIVVAGDRTRIGTQRALRLPAPPRP